MTEETMIEKIEKLLALAQSSNPHEAELATAQAEKLMVKYGIEIAMLDEKRRQQKKAGEKIVTVEVRIFGRYGEPMHYMTEDIVRGLGNIRSYHTYDAKASNSTKNGHIHLVGYESDVKHAEMLISSLMLQALIALKPFMKTDRIVGLEPKIKYRECKEFIRGFGTGVYRRLALTRETAIGETKGTGAELVLVDRKARVDAWMDENMQLTSGKSRSRRGSVHANTVGFTEGGKANTGDKAVKNQTAISS